MKQAFRRRKKERDINEWREVWVADNVNKNTALMAKKIMNISENKMFYQQIIEKWNEHRIQYIHRCIHNIDIKVLMNVNWNSTCTKTYWYEILSIMLRTFCIFLWVSAFYRSDWTLQTVSFSVYYNLQLKKIWVHPILSLRKLEYEYLNKKASNKLKI